jgi:hypothetical protein
MTVLQPVKTIEPRVEAIRHNSWPTDIEQQAGDDEDETR